MSNRLDRLVCRTIFSQTNTIVCGDGDGTEFGERSKPHCAGGVGDKVEEGAAEGDDCSVGGETIHNSFHRVFADAVADVSAGPFTEFGARLKR